MKQKLLIFFLFGLFSLQGAFAQNRKITGTVTSSDDGQPLPGVSVQLSGTGIGTQTDAQGSYSLNVPASARALTFTYIGYVQRTVQLNQQAVINVKLTADNKTLSEVVVVGYGTKTVREVNGSIGHVSGSTISNQ